VVPSGGPLKHLHAIAHPVLTASGELEELMATVVDVTERRRAAEEHRAQLRRPPSYRYLPDPG
jgi:hypothetical protein